MNPETDSAVTVENLTSNNGILSDPEKNSEIAEGVTPITTDVPYSVFTKGQKLWIAIFSTMSSYIYYPALVPAAHDLGISVALVNLRIALQSSYAALLVLRMLQSAGASALVTITYGVIADITQSKDSGGFVGVFLVFTDIALSMGPILGGGITQQLGWRWILWFLIIVISITALVMLLFFPETQRRIVGNRSAKVRGIYWSFFSLFQAKTSPYSAQISRPVRHWPKPFACLPILRDKGSLTVTFIYSVICTVKMTLQTSLGAPCVEIYELNYLDAGLIYLPSGIAGGVYDWRGSPHKTQTAQTAANIPSPGKLQTESENNDSTDSTTTTAFPLEKTRLRGIYLLVLISSLGTLGYGLALVKNAPFRENCNASRPS
ncbi:major facilitator superfamily domain-containing protein [Triangularia setosa]|uniref:Major facilitator superfamily domain-containing protein n=1 Tax=Triangularia setosa TaxID=2587417 RepID=A0AAN6WB80_9PEZI|nr:major facilitator superfamily domain-containing protein [Podospora setosa]